MKMAVFLFIFLTLLSSHLLNLGAEASLTEPLLRHLSSLLKWTSTSPDTPQSDGNIVQFENGYLVATVVEKRNKLGVEPYSIRVSPEGELFAVDFVNNNIARITPPLSQYSRARLVAGSHQGHPGYVDGKPSDARFHRPKGVTIDDKGNIYVSDVSNNAIRKIGEAGVTTIAGGKSNEPGYRDGPSEEAKFSKDFDVIYNEHSCSLLVIDRGNAAIREISLHRENCMHEDNSISSTDIFMVVAAILVGYTSGRFQRGFRSSFPRKKQDSESKFQEQTASEKSTSPVETVEEELIAKWPSFGRLLTDLLNLALEGLVDVIIYFVPHSLRFKDVETSVNPIIDTLTLPEDKPDPPIIHEQRQASLVAETLDAGKASDSYMEQNYQKSKETTLKAYSFRETNKCSTQEESTAPLGLQETTRYSQLGLKSLNDRLRLRHRNKSGEVVLGAVGLERKPVEIKPMNYDDPKFNQYNVKSTFGADDPFQF